MAINLTAWTRALFQFDRIAAFVILLVVIFFFPVIIGLEFKLYRIPMLNTHYAFEIGMLMIVWLYRQLVLSPDPFVFALLALPVVSLASRRCPCQTVPMKH